MGKEKDDEIYYLQGVTYPDYCFVEIFGTEWTVLL